MKSKKFKLAKGWTKAKVMARIKKYNNNNRAESSWGCMYEAHDGNKCAIGCFIPDGHKGREVRNNVASLLKEYPELRSHMPFDNIDALSEFQKTHDLAKNGQVYGEIMVFLDKFVK